MLEYVKGFLPPPLSKPASALLEILLNVFTKYLFRVTEQAQCSKGYLQQRLKPIVTIVAKSGLPADASLQQKS
jgi:hypothetical protein